MNICIETSKKIFKLLLILPYLFFDVEFTHFMWKKLFPLTREKSEEKVHISFPLQLEDKFNFSDFGKHQSHPFTITKSNQKIQIVTLISFGTLKLKVSKACMITLTAIQTLPNFLLPSNLIFQLKSCSPKFILKS